MEKIKLTRNQINIIEASYNDIFRRVVRYLTDNKEYILTPYIENKHFSIYIRKDLHVCDRTIQIARITIKDSKYHGHGYGTKLITGIYNIKMKYTRIEVECVGNKGLARWLSNNGWDRIPPRCPDSTPSFYRLKT